MNKLTIGLGLTALSLLATPGAAHARPDAPALSCNTVTPCAEAWTGCWHWAFGICKGAHAGGSHSGVLVTGFLNTTTGHSTSCGPSAGGCNTYLSISGANLCGMVVTANTATATGPAVPSTAVLTC